MTNAQLKDALGRANTRNDRWQARYEQEHRRCEELARIVKADEHGAAKAHQLAADFKDALLSMADTSGDQPCWCFVLREGSHDQHCQRIRATMLRLAPSPEREEDSSS